MPAPWFAGSSAHTESFPRFPVRIFKTPLLLLGLVHLTAFGGLRAGQDANAELFARRQLCGSGILSSGETSYGAALVAAYGPLADSALVQARRYRATLDRPGYLTRLDPATVRRSMRIVVDPSAGTTGFHGWADRQSGTIVIGHPGGHLGAESPFWATIMHESSHAAQVEPDAAEARGLLTSVWTDLLRHIPPGTSEFDRYLPQPDEIEVRLMDLARFHFSRTGRLLLTPADAARALVSLGAPPWRKGIVPLPQHAPGPDPVFPDASSIAVLCRRLAADPTCQPMIAAWLEALCVLAPGLP